MTAGTGDGDGRTCGTCMYEKSCLNYDCLMPELLSWRQKFQMLGMPYIREQDKLQPQVAPPTPGILNVLDSDVLIDEVASECWDTLTDEAFPPAAAIRRYRDAVRERINKGTP